MTAEAQVARTYDINGFGPISVSPAEMLATFRRIPNQQFAAQARSINTSLDRIARARAAGYRGPLTRQEAAIQARGR